MLLEYAVLVGTLAIALVAIVTEFYNHMTGEFGEFGEEIVLYFQRLVTVISLPVP